MTDRDARPFDVLLVGELNVDLILRGDVEPRFGQVEKLVDDSELCAGSSAAIFAAGAAKMGLRVAFVSVVGDDLFGRYMIDALNDAGVDARHVQIDPALKTGLTLILDKPDGRAILTYLGSMAHLSARHLPDGWTRLARHWHIASPFLLSSLRPDLPRLIAEAKAAGMTVSLDTNWDPEERWALEGVLDQVDVFLPNDAELLAIAARSATVARSPIAAYANLSEALERVAARVPLVVVKRGAEGSLAARGAERVNAPGYAVDVLSTTGAGDTFDAGFLAAWLRGEPLPRCLALGNAAGALTTTQVGGFNGQPTWAEAERFVASAL